MAKRRWLRRTLGLGLLAGAAYAIWRALEANRVVGKGEWEPQPFPFPPQPRTDSTRTASQSPAPPPHALAPKATETVAERANAPKAETQEEDKDTWVAPMDGACPASHPVKAKESSKIFHVPGGQSYDRTLPDRCYVDAAAAEDDGFRAAKR